MRRRTLDTLPRAVRLELGTQRALGSLLDLEEKGLLEGGGLLPSAAALDLNKPSRLALEMLNRSCRKHVSEQQSAPLEGVFHMLRVIGRQFPLGDFFAKSCEISDRVPRKNFEAMLKSLLPISSKELSRIYEMYSTDQRTVQFLKFIRDAGAELHQTGKERSSADSPLQRLKSVIEASLSQLGKPPNHLYKLFATYDRTGTGVCTTLQFVRVLGRIHACLSDVDEDAVTDVLDTGAGRIRYVAYLKFCFADGSLMTPPLSSTARVRGGRPQSALVQRAVSPDGSQGASVDFIRNQRPLTATARLNSSSASMTASVKSKLEGGSVDAEDDDYIKDVFDDDAPARRFSSDNQEDDYSEILEDGGSVASNISFVVESPSRGVLRASDGSSAASSVNWFGASEHTVSALSCTEEEEGRVRLVLARLRELIAQRLAQGKGIRDVFMHFDRADSGYFGSDELLCGLGDLKLVLPPHLAQAAIAAMAVDGVMRVSLAEFTLFARGIDCRALDAQLRDTFLSHLNKSGVDFLKQFNRYFDCSNAGLAMIFPLKHSNIGSIDLRVFIESFRAIGVSLAKSDLQILAARFDVHGTSRCCIARFVKIFRECPKWREAEVEALDAEVAYQEALKAKRMIATSVLPSGSALTMDLVNMAEYLCIKCLTEPHLLWIARQALQAPLPPHWITRKGEHGAPVFVHELTQKTQQEHPLDPHYRLLRDMYRTRCLYLHSFHTFSRLINTFRALEIRIRL